MSGTILSPLGDCKCILPSLPGSTQLPLQLVVHTVARVTFPKCPSDHVTTKRPLEMASIVFPTTPYRAWSPLTCPIFPPRSGGYQTMGLPSTWPPLPSGGNTSSCPIHLVNPSFSLYHVTSPGKPALTTRFVGRKLCRPGRHLRF